MGQPDIGLRKGPLNLVPVDKSDVFRVRAGDCVPAIADEEINISMR